MLRVLLVEDNDMNRDMLVRRLSKQGFNVSYATDGMSGVAEAAQSQPDLILMDMSLPILDGWTATQQIKTNPMTSHIPVIGLSSHAMDADRDRAMQAGCDDYDTKPVDLKRLLGKIDAQIAARLDRNG